MWTHVTTSHLVRRKRSITYPDPKESGGASSLRDSVSIPHVGVTMPVRVAKARLSSLLEYVAAGNTVTITSDGKPKAVLSPVSSEKARVGFEPAWDLLGSTSVPTEGPFGTELIRADRDGREV